MNKILLSGHILPDSVRLDSTTNNRMFCVFKLKTKVKMSTYSTVNCCIWEPFAEPFYCDYQGSESPALEVEGSLRELEEDSKYVVRVDNYSFADSEDEEKEMFSATEIVKLVEGLKTRLNYRDAIENTINYTGDTRASEVGEAIIRGLIRIGQKDDNVAKFIEKLDHLSFVCLIRRFYIPNSTKPLQRRRINNFDSYLFMTTKTIKGM